MRPPSGYVSSSMKFANRTPPFRTSVRAELGVERLGIAGVEDHDGALAVTGSHR